jgi:hypothetical protein
MKITRLTDGPYVPVGLARLLSAAPMLVATVVLVERSPAFSRCGRNYEPTGLASGEVSQRARDAGDVRRAGHGADQADGGSHNQMGHTQLEPRLGCRETSAHRMSGRADGMSGRSPSG